MRTFLLSTLCFFVMQCALAHKPLVMHYLPLPYLPKDTIADSAVYKLPIPVQAGMTVSWSASPTGLVTLSPSADGSRVTVSRVSNGSVTIKATVNSNCGDMYFNNDVVVNDGLPHVTVGSVSACVNTATTNVRLDAPPGTVLGLKITIGGSASYLTGPPSYTVRATAYISGYSAADVYKTWTVSSSGTGTGGFFYTSDTPAYVTVPPSGQLNLTTYANLENGGTIVNATLSIVSVNGSPGSQGTGVCAWYSTGPM